MAVATEGWSAYYDYGNLDSDDGALSLDGRGGLSAEEALYLALRGGLTEKEVVSLALEGGLKPEEVFSVALRSGLSTEELLLVQLLASFDRRELDPELLRWTKMKGPPECPFFLFKMKASAKNAKVSWWKKKYPRFSPERPGYTAALRVARLGADGVHLELAGEGGQPGALSYHIDMGYLDLRRPKGVFFNGASDVPLREVALVRRLPRGDGISITSHVNGLGVQLGEILFLLPCAAATVALSFTDQSLEYVPSKFTEEPLYARVGLDFINITVPLENLIQKIFHMYEQEEEDKKPVHEQQNDHEDSGELMRPREEQEREREELMRQRKEQESKKVESLRRRRAESKKYKCQRKEIKEMIGKVKLGGRTDEEQEQDREYEEEDCFCTLLFPSLEESDREKALEFSSPKESEWAKPLEFPSPEESNWENPLEFESDQEKPLEPELCEREVMHMGFREGAMKFRVINDLVNLGGGGNWENWLTDNPVAV